MAIARPFFRCFRPGTDGHYHKGGRWLYVIHPDYAPDATHYQRAFSILQADMLRLFEYVEPADNNESAFSFRCLELLVRACGEVEANCRAILEANGYSASAQLTMIDYRKLEPTHHLSSYEVRLPVWIGQRSIRKPFARWKSGSALPWFSAHHGGKHNRHHEFPSASFGNVIDAVCAVFVLLSAQFGIEDYGPSHLTVNPGGLTDDFERGIGNYLYVRFPTDWADADCYDFDWQSLKGDPRPFVQLSF
jgi:hypothetical protein